mgnify:CR=1 FL=1
MKQSKQTVYKLVMTEKIQPDDKGGIKFPINAILINKKSRKKKRVFLKDMNELNYWLEKKEE